MPQVGKVTDELPDELAEIRARLVAYLKYRWNPEHKGCLCVECVNWLNAHHEYNEHNTDNIAALLAEVERLQAENKALLSANSVTIQMPPVTETALVARTLMDQWRLEAMRLRAEVGRLRAASTVCQPSPEDALEAERNGTPLPRSLFSAGPDTGEL